MTSRNLFFRLMKEDLRRKIWAVGLAFLSFFFCMPVATAMGISGLDRELDLWEKNGTTFEGGMTAAEYYQERLARLAENVVGLDNIVTAMVIIGAAVVLGLTGFSWLHSKKKVDFYNSVPVRREELFLTNYLNSFLIIAVTYLINVLAATGILAGNGVSLGDLGNASFVTFGVHMTGFLLMYSVTTAAVLLTGNFFISILGGMVLWGYIPAVLALMMGMESLFFETASYRAGYRGGGWYSLMVHGSPISQYIYLIDDSSASQMAQYGLDFRTVGLTFLAGLAISALCLLLYKIRPSEAAEKAMAFSITKAPIKMLLVTPITIAMGVFFWNIYYSLAWAVFGFFFGLLISHGIIEIIYHFEFRKLFANLPHMAACAVLALVIIGVYRYDLTGYDRYLPREDKLESVSMNISDLSDWNDYGIPKTYENGSNGWIYLNQSDYVDKNMKVTDYGMIQAIAQSGIDTAATVREIRFSGGDIGTFYYGGDQEKRRSRVEMSYHLKNGKTVYRDYMVDLDALRESIDALYVTREYKEGAYPVMSYGIDNLTGIYSGKDHRIQKVEATREEMEAILSAYQEELTALTLEDRSREIPVTALRFLTIAEQEYLRKITINRTPGFVGDFDLDNMEFVNFFPVYPSFTRTIELLEQAGIRVNESIRPEQVERIEVINDYPRDAYQSDDNEAEEGETAGEAVLEESDAVVSYGGAGYPEAAEATWDTVYDRQSERSFVIHPDTEEGEKMTQEILDSVSDQNLCQLNRLYPIDESIWVRVFLKNGDGAEVPLSEEYHAYYFRDGEIPEFVKALTNYDQIVDKNIREGL